jgi:hypothetical protein
MTKLKKNFTIGLYYDKKKNYFKKFHEFYKNNLSHLNLNLVICIKNSKYSKIIEESLKDYDFNYKIIKFTTQNEHIKMLTDITYLTKNQQEKHLKSIINDRRKLFATEENNPDKDNEDKIYEQNCVKIFVDNSILFKNSVMFGKNIYFNEQILKPDTQYEVFRTSDIQHNKKYNVYSSKITHSYKILLSCINLNITNINSCWINPTYQK